jgi:hypothetical protein
MGYVMNFDVLFYYIVLSISILLLLSCRCRKMLEVPSSHPEEMNLSLEPSPFLGILCPCLHHHILISKLSLYCLKKRSCVMENPRRTGWPPCVLFVAPKGLCIRCAEKWSREHKCVATVQLHVVQELFDLFTWRNLRNILLREIVRTIFSWHSQRMLCLALKDPKQ